MRRFKPKFWHSQSKKTLEPFFVDDELFFGLCILFKEAFYFKRLVTIHVITVKVWINKKVLKKLSEQP